MNNLYSTIIRAFRATTLLLFLTISFSAKAQIAYQVSLLNNATGEPRANESVNVTVKITDSAGNVICEQTKHETTNDFGILSMSIGNTDTFADADWSKLPLFIEAIIDGRLIGRSQLLSVPVAEHAKHTGSLTKEILCSKEWKCTIKDPRDNSIARTHTLSFKSDETFKRTYYNNSEGKITGIDNGTYEIDGNLVTLYYTENPGDEIYKVGSLLKYSNKFNTLSEIGERIYE